MLSIDREAHTPVREQLAEQLRYQIASGRFQTGETLPSTRELGDRLDVSFHTVRKAYQALRDEGLLETQSGRGYTVKERTPLSKSERMERGAAEVRQTLQRLIGLGLTEDEVEYLLQEQIGLLEHTGRAHKLIFAAPYRELAEQIARQLTRSLQRSVEATPIEHLGRHRDADFVLTPYPHLRTVLQQVPRADVHGLVTYLHPQALERVSRLLPHETLGLVTRYADAIPPLTRELRTHTGFTGQTMAASIEAGTDHLASFIEQTDLIACTPGSRTRLRAAHEGTPPVVELAFAVSPDSVAALREVLPV